MARRGFNRRIAEKVDVKGGVTAGVAVQIIAVYTMTVVFISALVMWLIDEPNFPNFGISLWWAVQTVTTVGYGDVLPTSITGRVVAALVMLTGIGLITVVAGAVASGLAQTVARRRGVDLQERMQAEIEAIHRRLDDLGAPPRD